MSPNFIGWEWWQCWILGIDYKKDRKGDGKLYVVDWHGRPPPIFYKLSNITHIYWLSLISNESTAVSRDFFLIDYQVGLRLLYFGLFFDIGEPLKLIRVFKLDAAGTFNTFGCGDVVLIFYFLLAVQSSLRLSLQSSPSRDGSLRMSHGNGEEVEFTCRP
jgi:hypothetical protein